MFTKLQALIAGLSVLASGIALAVVGGVLRNGTITGCGLAIATGAVGFLIPAYKA